MKSIVSQRHRVWIVLLAGAIGFVVWGASVRIKRVQYVTDIGAEVTQSSDASLTGLVHGFRELIVPEHIGASYEAIAQTQKMLAEQKWHHVEEENAPFGRDSHAASAYRWWLGFLAHVDRFAEGGALGAAVERAALYADSALQVLLLISLAFYCARQFRAPSTIAVILGVVGAYPFGAGFVPGCPDDFALLLFIVPWCLLPIVAALTPPGESPASHTSDQAAIIGHAGAGAIAGLGLWLSVATLVPIIVGIAVGGIMMAAAGRQREASEPWAHAQGICWRWWALGGAAVTLVSYLWDYAPSRLGAWELRAIHPLYGLAWLGMGELVARIGIWVASGRAVRGWAAWAASCAAIGAVAAVPIVMAKTHNPGFMTVDPLSFRLTRLPDGIMAVNFSSWLSGGVTGPLVATLLPLLVLGMALVLLFRRATGAARIAIAFALGPSVVVLGLAYFHLRWWQIMGGVCLALMVPVAAALWPRGTSFWRYWAGLAVAAALFCPGILQVIPARNAATNNVLTVSEVEGLVERDLARWIATNANRSGGVPIVLAPPSTTSALIFYGGLEGLGTLSWENKDGLAVALRIVISTSRDEALALIRKRGVTHIVIPSWDEFFEPYKRSSSMQTSELFFAGLDRWSLPPWLRPIPYQLPHIAGFENQSVRVFEVVDEQDEPVAAGRLTEYFIEMGEVENAKIAGKMLEQYPFDLSASIAKAQLAAALADAPEFTSVFASVVQRLSAGADRYLDWERRASLAVVLARGNRPDLARTQAERCFAEMDEGRLRRLTPFSRFRLLALGKALSIRISDPDLRRLALELVPPELRSRL